jgi:hypothetical protein
VQKQIVLSFPAPTKISKIFFEAYFHLYIF